MSLRPIASAVAGWSRALASVQPASAESDRPETLDAISAAWPDLVGAEVARHCAPLELAGHALVVATRSSAWSQQLQFLETRVLAGVRTLPGAGHLRRLRFRSGGLAPRARAVAFGRTRTVPRKTLEVPYVPARDLPEALARLRARFAQPSVAGGACCERCATSLAERPFAASRCAPCEAETTRERQHAAQRLLYETPWFGRDAVLDAVPGLTHDEYDLARRALLGRWWIALERARKSGSLSRDGNERRIATSYVILQSRLPPDRIAPAVMRNVLGEALAALLFGETMQDAVTARAPGV